MTLQQKKRVDIQLLNAFQKREKVVDTQLYLPHNQVFCRMSNKKGESVITAFVQIITRFRMYKLITYLTFISSVVSLLDKLDLKCPVIRSIGMEHVESFIVCVRCFSTGQNMPVSSSNPGYLKGEELKI